MAINKKGSRRIVVEDTVFRWRATGGDGAITVVIWPESNDSSRLISSIRYHQKHVRESDKVTTLHNQIIVTNRLVRRFILHHGVDRLASASGQIDGGAFEDVIDISDAVRADD